MANEAPHGACVDMDCVYAWASQLCPRPFRFFQFGGTSGTTSSHDLDNGAHGMRLCDSIYAFHEPQEQEHVDVEIVFIHGLEFDGSKEAYWKTWLARDGTQDTCWPKTWLVGDFPHARILYLSYDANVVQTSTSGSLDLYNLGESLIQEMTLARIGQHECPVLFVCHSFGGFVAKQIVVIAIHKFQQDEEVQNFLRNLRGFYFYDTPHGGVQGDFSPSNPFTSKGKSLNYLDVFNPEVGRLNSEFERNRHEVYNNEWICFNVGAMYATPHGRVVVPESSARQSGVQFLPISASHFDVCRPKSKIDTNYQSLTNLVSKVIKFHDDKHHGLLDLPNGLVGLEDKKQYICQKLGIVSIFGLVGMGGIGKTTISKYVYNSQAKFYDKTCFLQDVRSKGVACVQKELLLELCGVDLGNSNFVSSNHLWSIKQCIMRKRVLLVIDDVGDSETLKSLQVPSFQRSLSSGSQVIVTCRNRQVLDNHIAMEGLKDVEVMVVDILSYAQALELFCFHVFHGIEDKDDEMEDFGGLALDIAKACGGLPLSLEVIGQHLRKQHVHSIGMRKGIWEEALRKLGEAKSFDGGDENEVLWRRLKISYDDLSDDTKSMFLDFACFFCEKSVVDLSEQSIGWIWNSPSGLQNLCARSLIKVGGIHNQRGCFFTIHDQLRDMGRRIVKDLSLEGSRVLSKNVTRIWEAKEVVSFLEENEGSGLIEGMSLQRCQELFNFPLPTTSEQVREKTMQGFDRLRLLDMTGCHIKVVDYILRRCSEKVSWLCLNYVWGQKLPHPLETIGFCTELRVLQLRFSAIVELPRSIGKLVHLLELDLTVCWNLQSLPSEIGHLKQLKRLVLNLNSGLEEVPPSISQLTNLEYLGLDMCSHLKKMIEFETQMDHLYELDLTGCRGFRKPFKSLGKLHQLRALNMNGCENLVIENPSESFVQLSRLVKLNLRSCTSLISGFRLKNFVGEHSQEEAKKSWDLLIESFSSRLQELHLPVIPQVGFLAFPRLKTLKVDNGCLVDELPESLGNLFKLEFLSVSDVYPGFLKKLPNSIRSLVKLKVLELHNMGALYRLPDNLGHLSLLQRLDLLHMTILEELPTSIGHLSQLEEFVLVDCESLKCLPESFTSLTRLRQVTLRGCKELVELPTTLGQLCHLEHLRLDGCQSLKRLPKSSSSLVRLLQLRLERCNALEKEDANQKLILQKLEQRGCKIYF